MRKLALCTLGFAAALLLAHYVLPEGALLWCAAGLGLLCLAGLGLRGDARTRLLIVCVSAVCALGWYRVCDALFIKPCEELKGRTLTVTACVTDYPVFHEDYARVDLRLVTEGLPGALTALYDYDGHMTELKPGDIIEAEVKFSSATVRGGEETDSFIARGVSALAYLRESPRVTGRSAAAFLYFPRDMSRAVRETVDIIFPSDSAAFMKAMLIGDKLDLYDDDALYVALSRSGLLHVTAVSGMHLAFVYGCVRFFIRSRKRAAFVGIALLWLFALMAGASPSALRAAIMLSMVLVAPFLRREADGITSLCAALLPMLIVNPFAIGSASLQLSFSAMAGIVLLSPRVYGWAGEKWKKPEKGRGVLRRTLIASFASSVGAMAFVTPAAALRFSYVSLVSPLSYLLVLWALSLCFLGGYACVIIGLFWSALGKAAAWLISWLARYITLVAKALSSLPFAAVYTADELIALWLVFCYAVFIFAYLRRGDKPFRPLVPLCVCVMTLCAVLGLNSVFYSSVDSAAVLDVGQGQCAAILSGPATVVVDCGGGGSKAGDAASDYLESRGRTRVDALVLTHLHEDHAGGVKRLLARMDVENLFLPSGVPDEDGLLEEILLTAERRGVAVSYVAEDTLVRAGDINLSLYAPMEAGAANERGLIILAAVGDWEMLITGDANSAVERRLVERGVLPDCEALIVGHHGSKNSTSLELLSACGAETAVISVGYNTYGHPAEETLKLLELFDMDVYRTDVDGSVVLRIGEDG